MNLITHLAKQYKARWKTKGACYVDPAHAFEEGFITARNMAARACEMAAQASPDDSSKELWEMASMFRKMGELK